MYMKYRIDSAHLQVHVLNLHCKTIYIHFPLKPFKAYLCIIISVRNDEFQSAVFFF